ncbi:hypothetical protein ACIPY0_20470 [Paenarthrobacter nicotinovorans]|uniref:hypothetical protein n=1 Tax=Paenarthrobacter nicotinovorans TaxID=29320 RepID=UPI0038072A8A
MSARVEAAAGAMWEQRPMRRDSNGAPVPFEDIRETYYRPRYMGQAEVALSAADSVMFSEAAIERAAEASGHKASVVRAVVAALREGA